MFIESIKKIYKSNEEESSIFGSSLLILIIIIIIFYFYLKLTQAQILLDWKNQKCNPKYVFFSYYMNPVEGQNPYETTKNNFIQCIKPFITILDTRPYKELKNTTIKIGKDTEDLEKSVNIINNDMDNKIKDWRNEYNTVDEKEKKLYNEANERYVKEKNMYESIRIYAQRIHDVIYSITFFIKNKLLFQVSENKINFRIKDFRSKNIYIKSDDVNKIRRTLYESYMKTCNDKYNKSFNLLHQKRREPNFDPQRTDFSASINTGYDAISEFQTLIDIIEEFNRQNHPPDDPESSLLNDTRQKCNQLKKFNMNCQEIFPNWPVPETLP